MLRVEMICQKMRSKHWSGIKKPHVRAMLQRNTTWEVCIRRA